MSNHAGSLHPRPATATELGPADVSSWEGRVLSFTSRGHGNRCPGGSAPSGCIHPHDQLEQRAGLHPLEGLDPSSRESLERRGLPDSLLFTRVHQGRAGWAEGPHLSRLTALALTLRRGWDGPLVAVVREGGHELRLTGCGEKCVWV